MNFRTRILGGVSGNAGIQRVFGKQSDVTTQQLYLLRQCNMVAKLNMQQ